MIDFSAVSRDKNFLTSKTEENILGKWNND